jgi:ABC-2 type transport system permease protein
VSITLPTYTRREMPLLPRRRRIRAIVTTGLRREFRRPAAQVAIVLSILPTALLSIFTLFIFSVFPGGPTLGLSFFYDVTIDSNPTILLFVAIMAAVVGSALIADDLQTMALTLYLSRPISPADYLLAKAAILFPLVSMVGILPLLLTPFLAAILGLVPWDIGLQAIAVGVGVGLLLTALYAAVSLFLSSLTHRKSYAAAGVFAVTFGLTIPTEILALATSNNAVLYLSPWENFLAVARIVYGAEAGRIDWPLGLAILVGVTILASLATYLRMRAIEVVSG